VGPDRLAWALMSFDASDNAFTGILPASLFYASPALTSFAAVKNFFTGSLPAQSICANASLQTLALDGLHIASSCQHHIFLAASFLLPQLFLSLVQQPDQHHVFVVLFVWHRLIEDVAYYVRESGNAITGSLPSDVFLQANLSDVSYRMCTSN
jgi:hypothetical protein